ncbi:MAG: AMP-binding protein [Lachnospiraceae bacterium]|nr:AMP-binding protein [Lachnospiraceae bacterium]
MNDLITDYLENFPKEYEHKKAFVSPEESVTYGKLRENARSVATFLIQKKLFHKPIALILPESIACVACFLGVAYSGNYYAPFDPAMPENRLKMVLRQFAPEFVIVKKQDYLSISEMTKEAGVSKIVVYEDIATYAVDADALRETRNRLTDADLLYVLYTSGSTGTPKGVAVPHKNVNFVCESHSRAFSLNGNSIVGNQFAIYFAASVFVIYTTIRNYATCLIGFGELVMNPHRWNEYIQSNGVNTLTGMPATFRLLQNSGCTNGTAVKNVSKIIFGGDKMYVWEARKLLHIFDHARMFSVFGATEIGGITFTIEVNQWLEYKKRADDEILPMGRKFDNVDILLLDEKMERAQEGEMYIRFSAIPYGYYDNAEKTAEAYVQNPVNPHYPERVFKSRDKVKLNDEGIYEYLGRMDFMIKRHGYRIEPGDIENAAYHCNGVEQCCCIYVEDEEQLCLFYAGELKEAEFYKSIKKELPSYMMPNRIIKLEELPLNINGKYDRKALEMIARQG